LLESLESIEPLGELSFVIGGTVQIAGVDRAVGVRHLEMRGDFLSNLYRLAAEYGGAHSRYCKSAQIDDPDQATPKGRVPARPKSQQ
jgi:hypothetical protein